MSLLRLIFEPLGNWTDPITDPRPYCRFRAGYDDTLRILEIEAYELDAEQLVVQVDVNRAELRQDGKLRQNARPVFPGVRVSFKSRYGPLTYATDRFDDWRDNLRAITLSLVALRAVDRYGANKRGEQYTGWLAIAAGPNMDLGEAQRLLASYGGAEVALRATHPDTCAGIYDADKFEAVKRARHIVRTTP